MRFKRENATGPTPAAAYRSSPAINRVPALKADDDVVSIPSSDRVVSVCAENAESGGGWQAHVGQKREPIKLLNVLRDEVDKEFRVANCGWKRAEGAPEQEQANEKAKESAYA